MFKFKQGRGLRSYGFATGLTVIIILSVLLFSGWHSLLPIIALAAIEITFSFENAVINSRVLAGMKRFWRTIFLTVGIAIAVFGARALLPLGLVAAAANEPLGQVLDLALHQPDLYAHQLEKAYPVIAAFGGVFLLMVGLRFFGERKKVTWLNGLEAPLGEFNQPWWVSISGATLAISVIYILLAPGDTSVAIAGALGATTFLIIKFISKLLVNRSHNTARHGLIQFIYLELLDASFSFDSVIAAFAITKDVVLIMAGLGIGALYLRSMTVHLLREGTLTQYRYLVHGAHYAILSLAVLLMAGIKFAIPEAMTGLLGLAIILIAFESSRRHNRRQVSA